MPSLKAAVVYEGSARPHLPFHLSYSCRQASSSISCQTRISGPTTGMRYSHMLPASPAPLCRMQSGIYRQSKVSPTKKQSSSHGGQSQMEGFRFVSSENHLLLLLPSSVLSIPADASSTFLPEACQSESSHSPAISHSPPALDFPVCTHLPFPGSIRDAHTRGYMH